MASKTSKRITLFVVYLPATSRRQVDVVVLLLKHINYATSTNRETHEFSKSVTAYQLA